MRPVGCLITAVVVLAGLAVVGDRVAEQVVENRLADEAETEFGTRPKVEIGGFPFLTQLIARRFGEVEVTAASVAERGVEVEDVRLLFRGVNVISRNEARVDTATGAGVVSFATLEEAAGQAGVKLAREGEELRASGNVEVLGREVAVTARGALSVSDNTVVFSPSEFSAEGVPSRVTDALKDAVGSSWNIRLAVNGLPEGVRLEGIRPVDDGVEVQLGGSGLLLGA